MSRPTCNQGNDFATGLLQGPEARVYNSTAMIKKATVTILLVLSTAAGAMAQQVPDEVTDNFTGPVKPAAATLWAAVFVAAVLVVAVIFIAFKDPRRTHLDEQK